MRLNQLAWFVATMIPPLTLYSQENIPKDFPFHNSSLTGVAYVRVVPERVTPGETFALECGFRCTTGIRRVYDPFLVGLEKEVVRLLLISADGKKKIDLGSPSLPRDVALKAPRWVELRGNEGVGRRVSISLTEKSFANSPSLHAGKLEPGDYFVYAEYNPWFFAFRPQDTAFSNAAPTRTEVEGNGPIARSELVKFTIVAPNGQPPDGEKANLGKELEDKKHGEFLIALRFKDQSLPEKFGIDVRYRNLSDKYVEVFNPFFNPLFMMRAVEVMLFDRKQNAVGNLWRREGGSSFAESASSWLNVPPGAIIDSTISFRYEPDVTFKDLPSGQRFIQLLVHDKLFSSCPPELKAQGQGEKYASALLNWWKSGPGEVVAKSNLVEVRF